jgi:imidazolonepropionase-like amidohydrolase
MLVRHDVPVVIARTLRLPHRRDLSYATTFELPAQLEQAGVRWCLAGSTADAAGTRNLPYEAAACIAFGLDPEVALRSVTLAPAEVLGLGQRLGSLEAGKAATLFVADGDPFELWTTIEAAWIDGRQVVLTDKQTALDAKYREKYRQLGLLR